MASIASKKVSPIDDNNVGFEPDALDPMEVIAPETEEPEPSGAPHDEVNIATILKRATQRTYEERFYEMMSYITYDNAKNAMRYALESASFTLTFSVSGSRQSVLILNLLFRLLDLTCLV
jgi:hypothetical protein